MTRGSPQCILRSAGVTIGHGVVVWQWVQWGTCHAENTFNKAYTFGMNQNYKKCLMTVDENRKCSFGNGGNHFFKTFLDPWEANTFFIKKSPSKAMNLTFTKVPGLQINRSATLQRGLPRRNHLLALVWWSCHFFPSGWGFLLKKWTRTSGRPGNGPREWWMRRDFWVKTQSPFLKTCLWEGGLWECACGQTLALEMAPEWQEKKFGAPTRRCANPKRVTMVAEWGNTYPHR